MNGKPEIRTSDWQSDSYGESDCQSEIRMTTDYREFYRRNLPHWQPPGTTLFITFRLAGSLPQTVLAALQAQRDEEARVLLTLENVEERQKQAYLDTRRAFGRWDTVLDTAKHGPWWLANPQIAAIVDEALHYRHQRVYDLLAFCIMSTYVHLVCTPLQRENGTYHAHQRILQSLKRHTARRANIILQRRGAFWQAESYDHFVRNAGALERIIQYVINNPVKAGLVSERSEWPWSYCASDTYSEWQSELYGSECHSDLRGGVT